MLARGIGPWLDLPELLIGENAPRTCKVIRVGFSMVPAPEVQAAGIDVTGIPDMPQGLALPTVTIEGGGDEAERLFRLPLGLANWALDVVAHTRMSGVSPFPCNVEFGLRASRYTADLL